MSIKLYIERVTKQMRNKEARASVEKELTQHFHHQVVKLKEQGATQQEAERKAIELMGNATTLGQSMDQIYKSQTDWLLIGLAIAAILCSFLALPYGQQVENGTLILKNSLYTVFGIGIALLITRFDYRKLLTFGQPLFWLGVALSFVLDFMHQSMLLWSFYKIMLWMQPICLLWTVCLAIFMTRKMNIWLLNASLMVIFIALVTTLSQQYVPLFGIIFAIMLLCSNYRISQKIWSLAGWLILVGLALTYYYVLIYPTHGPYLMLRVAGMEEVNQYLQTILQSAHFIGASDVQEHIITFEYILLNIIQQFGFLALAIALALIALLIIHFVKTSQTIQQPFGQMLLIGIGTFCSLLFISNVLSSLGLFNIGAFMLPFFDYGLISTLSTGMLTGLLLSIYRRKNLFV